jgi:nickel-dependent lactate racemase
MAGMGFTDRDLTDVEFESVVREGLASLPVDGQRILVLIPDGTRSMPMPLVFTLLEKHLAPRVAALDFLVALGTHMPMTDEQLGKLVGREVREGRCGKARIFNHEWDDPSSFAEIGVVSAREIHGLSGGRFSLDVPVEVNRLVLDYDHILITGPVFPHEVAGFSGGTKYLFPGIAGREVINATHWLGALITNREVIGTRDTPVRALIDRAASFVPRPSSLLALVVSHDGVAGAWCGELRPAWEAAAALSARRHIIWLERPVRRVLSIMPEMYDDLWTAAKGMYKLEPAVADGGEVIIYAPHVHEVSYAHGKILDEVGYHCRDFFVAQWDRYSKYPWGVLAHSTHVKGQGTYDVATGKERPRIRVTLATGIPKERCQRIDLGYQDPATIDPSVWADRAEEGTLVVPRAGEHLYRIGNPLVE